MPPRRGHATNAANETEANEADDAVKVVEAVETEVGKTNDAIKVVKTVAADDVCCFDYGCGETFAKQPMSQSYICNLFDFIQSHNNKTVV